MAEAEKLQEAESAAGRKKAGAKTYSLVGQVVAAAWMVFWNSLKFARMIQGGRVAEIDTADIVLSGISIAACFSPVYVSILMDKIKDIRFGK